MMVIKKRIRCDVYIGIIFVINNDIDSLVSNENLEGSFDRSDVERGKVYCYDTSKQMRNGY